MEIKMIVLSPYSRPLRNGKRNPKNFPYWKEVISKLKLDNIIQIGVEGEEKIVKDFRKGLSLKEIEDLIKKCDFWMSVDNFLPHLAHHVGKLGIVIWSMSDPNVFGYPENINILKDRKYVRKNQFDMWDNYPYNLDAFSSVDKIIEEINNFMVKPN
jgi:ADP-heptose:LPS heptosyltransferase